MEWIAEPQAWIALATLTALEIVLGIDNIVFLSILTGRLEETKRPSVRRLGLLLAMILRVGLLFALSWIMQLDEPLFTTLDTHLSGRDLILLAGGLFLIAKSTLEIHHKLEGAEHDRATGKPHHATVGSVLIQIALIDLVFSLDSVITAVGIAEHLAVMVIAVLISVLVMMLFVNPICAFVERHPTFKMLALSFMLLIGVALVGEGLELHIPKGYLYFAMAFSLLVEFLNLRLRRGGAPVPLHGPRPEPGGDA